MSGVLSDEIGSLSSSGLTDLRSVLVSTEDSLGEFHGVTSEGITEFLGNHHLDDGSLSVNHLVLGGLTDGVLDIVNVGYGDAFGSHRSGDLSVGVVSLELRSDVSVSEPEDLVLLLGSPLSVVEDNSGGRDLFTNTSKDFVQRHSPGTVTDVGERRSLGTGNLGTDSSREGISTVTVSHGSEHGGLLVVETEVRVGDGADVSDIGGDHSVFGKGHLHLSEHGSGLHSSGFLSTKFGEGVKLGFPGGLQFGDVSFTLGLVGETSNVVFGLESSEHLSGGLFAISVDEGIDLLGETESSLVDINLDDFGVLGEVVKVVLREGSEDGESGSKSNDDISFMHGVHGGLVTLVSKVTYRKTMVGRERIVMEVSASDGNTKIFSESGNFIISTSHGDTTTSKDGGVLGVFDEIDSVGESGITSSGVSELLGSTDGVIVFSVEEITGNVNLDGSTFMHGNVEGLSGKLRHAGRVVNVSLEFGDGREDRNLIEFLETSVTLGHGTGFGGDNNDGGMSPVRRGDTGEEVGDTRTVLGDADSVSSRDTSITISHVGGVLLVSDRDKSDSSSGPEIKSIHESRSDDSEGISDTVSDHLLNEGLRVRHFGGDSEGDFFGVLVGEGTRSRSHEFGSVSNEVKS